MKPAGSRPLRILFVCLGDVRESPGARQIRTFARALADAGHRAHVLVQGDVEAPSELGEDDPRAEVGAYRLRMRRLRRDTLAAAEQFAPDLIHLYEPRHVPATAAAQLADHTGVPLFVRFADDDRSIEQLAGGKSRLVGPAKRLLRAAGTLAPGLWPLAHPKSLTEVVRRAAGLDAIAPALAREVERRFGRPCRCILPAVSPLDDEPSPASIPDLGMPPGVRLVLFAGSVFRAHWDDFSILLRAFRLLAARRSNVYLLQTGRVAERYRPELSALLGPAEARFRPLGFLPTEQHVRALMRRADVLVQPGAPTDFNRFRLPAKLHDYLVSGRPVVSYAVGVDELLDDGRHALLTRTAAPEELAAAIERLLENRDLAARIGRAGRERALELFAPERAAKELLDYYATAIPRLSAGARTAQARPE